MSDTVFFAEGEILIAPIRGTELVAFLHDRAGGQTRSIIIEAARPAVNAPSRLGCKAISSPRCMLPQSAQFH